MYRIFTLFLSFTLCLAVVSATFARSGIETVGENTKIDWTNNVLVATGEGAMPSPKEEPNRARAYLKAKTFARMTAIANLMMAAEGASIEYTADGTDFAATETIRQKIKGIAKTVQVVDTRKEQIEGGTIVVVKVKAPMPSELKQQASSGTSKTAKAPALNKPVKAPTQLAMLPESKSIPCFDPNAYTSLIIDAGGCGLQRSMSPKIRTSDGREVWGTVKVDYDFVEEHGIVAYANSLKEAKGNKRCGDNPLIIRAAGRAYGHLHSDPVISRHDANLILDENGRSGFLDSFNVIFVK